MLQVPSATRGSADHQGAVGDRVGHALIFFCVLEQLRSADGRTRFAKSHVVGIDYPQSQKTKVAHGTGGRADIERVARGHKHHAQTVGLS